MAKKATTYESGVVYEKTPHSSITATATSDPILIAGAKAVAIEYTEGGTVNNRSGDLTVDVSVDGGTTYIDYSMLLDNVADDNSQSLTRIASKTRAATGSDIVWMEPNTLGAITHIKVKVDITDGSSPTGNFTVDVAVQY